MRSRFGRSLLLAMLAALAIGVSTSGVVVAQSDDELVVAAFEVEPFVERTGDVPGGFLFESGMEE